jgi:DNA-binding transcriptional ArsR family regulator
MPSYPPIPKVKEFELGPDFEKFGDIVKIYTIGKTLVLEHYSGALIQSSYYNDDSVKTIKVLRNALVSNNAIKADFEIDQFLQLFSKLLIRHILDEAAKYESQVNEEKQEKNSIRDEIKQARELYRDITPEKWQLTSQEKYQNLYNVVQNKMPEIWPGLEFALSILRILNIEGCTLPFIGIILGRPSSGKTVIIDLLRKWYCSFYTDNFTARSFVSHSTAVASKEDLVEIDLLPKIKDKMFLTPELSPTFTAKDDDLTQLLGIITRIADGHGFVSDSGAHGHRGYDENIMFVWAGAAVDVPYKVYKVLGNLGAKLYFFRMKFEDKTDNQLLTQATTDQEFNIKFKEIQNALFDYLKWFEIGPGLIWNDDKPLPKIKWDKSKDDREAMRYIVRLAVLLSHLRCVAKTWETDDSQGSGYAYSVSQPEDPSRAITVLSNLARGHALLTGRNYITVEDIPVVVKTVMSTAQIERVSLFSLLIANNGKLTTRNILESLNISKPTALRTMAELKAIGLVDIEEEGQQHPPSKQIVLRPKFGWLLEDDLVVVKKNSPHTTTNISAQENEGNGLAKKEEMFWQVYDSLELEEQQEPSNFGQSDKDTVSGKKLQERLMATGEFHNGQAALIVENMVKAGRLKQVMLDTFARVSQ